MSKPKQVTVLLTAEQYEKIEELLKRGRAKDPMLSRNDVMRDIVDQGVSRRSCK